MNNLKNIVSLCKRRGFIYQSNEIYGGLKGIYDYGPFGIELKRNIEKYWWKEIVRKPQWNQSKVYGLDSAILTDASTMKASGHLYHFFDMISKCKLSGNVFRTDKASPLQISNDFKVILRAGTLEEKQKYKKTIMHICPNIVLEDHADGLALSVLPFSQSDDTLSLQTTTAEPFKIPHYGFSSPNSNSPFVSLPSRLNLMFRSFRGIFDPVTELMDGKPVDSDYISKSSVFLRPETAQGIMTNFHNVVNSFGATLPFGIGQIGKSFRNELQPEQFIFRTSEFEQMEVEFFTAEKDSNEAMNYWKEKRVDWWKSLLNNPERIRLRPHSENELAHYARECYDVEYEFPWGFGEIEGIANRTDFDLASHSRESGIELTINHEGNDIIPFVIECSAGLNRGLLAFLFDSYCEEMKKDGKTKRLFLKLNPKLAPVKAGIFPVVQKEPLMKIGQEIFNELVDEDICVSFEKDGSIGKRYAKNDEIGTPFGITIDSDTVQDNKVTVRDRDSGDQERISIGSIPSYIRKHLK